MPLEKFVHCNIYMIEIMILKEGNMYFESSRWKTQ